MASSTGIGASADLNLHLSSEISRHTSQYLSLPPQVRQEMQRLPGGPDEMPRILVLSSYILHLQREARELEPRLVLRPTPSHFHLLQAELARFMGAAGSSTRLQQMVHRLKVDHPSVMAVCAVSNFAPKYDWTLPGAEPSGTDALGLTPA